MLLSPNSLHASDQLKSPDLVPSIGGVLRSIRPSKSNDAALLICRFHRGPRPRPSPLRPSPIERHCPPRRRDRSRRPQRLSSDVLLCATSLFPPTSAGSSAITITPARRLSGSTIMPATPEYERNRLARIEKRKAEEAVPLANIRNIASQLNKWSDEENKKICAKNKENREAVKHHQTTGSRSYPSHFHQLKKDKYNNEDPSPIDFFKDANTSRKTGCMSAAALGAYTDMEKRSSEAQQEDEYPVSGTHIVAEVLKDHNSSSTFTMGYQSTSGRFRTSDYEERVRELEEKVEQHKREAIEANAMYQQHLTERGQMQEAALEEMQRKQQEELAAMKKSQEQKNKTYEKKQEEHDNLISFLLQKHATQN